MWSSSPSISINCVSKSLQTFSKITCKILRAILLNMFLRYFVTKTKCTCKLKTQCLPLRIFLSIILFLFILIDSMRFMKRRQAFKFRLKTKSKQATILLRLAGSCRYVYNRARQLQIDHYENGGKYLSYATLCKMLTEWKHEKRWLSNSHSQSLQQSLKDLDRAYRNFFQKIAQFPHKKHRNVHD